MLFSLVFNYFYVFFQRISQIFTYFFIGLCHTYFTDFTDFRLTAVKLTFAC